MPITAALLFYQPSIPNIFPKFHYQIPIVVDFAIQSIIDSHQISLIQFPLAFIFRISLGLVTTIPIIPPIRLKHHTQLYRIPQEQRPISSSLFSFTFVFHKKLSRTVCEMRCATKRSIASSSLVLDSFF